MQFLKTTKFELCLMPLYLRVTICHLTTRCTRGKKDIVRVLIKWRCYKYVFTCDIVKMFRQILIDPRDRDWLRIVYDFGLGLKHFRLCTVSYGTGPAPWQSLRVLRQLCQDFEITLTPELLD